MQDIFRTLPNPLTTEQAAAALPNAPASRDFAREVVAESARIGGNLLSFIQADDRRAFDDQRARVFGSDYSNRLTPDQAKTEFGLKVDTPINRHHAGYMLERQQSERFYQDVQANGGLSLADNLTAAIGGAATDWAQAPLFLLGGEGAFLRALGVGAGRTATGAVLRGAAVGSLEGIAPNVAIEVMDQGLRRQADLPAPLTNSAINIGIGAGLGAVLGAVVAPRVRAAPIPRDRVRTAMMAQETGGNPRQVSRDPDGAGPAGGGAVGALQLLPETAERMARRLNVPFDRTRLLNDVEYNVRLSDEYMNVLATRYDGDQFLAVTAYHAGEGNVDAWLRRLGDPRKGEISRSDWLERVGRNNPRSAHYPRAVFERMGLDIDDVGPVTAEARSGAVGALDGLTDSEKTGSALAAIDAMARDQPVDLGPVLARNGLEVLDEASAVPSIRGRWLEADTAVTRRGGEIPVRFAVVELGDLKTSHTDDLTPEAGYPQALQPRDRSRAGSQAGNYNLERDLNPALLMRDRAASGGAPIVSPDGLVESGNGRTIALRRSAATGTEAWGRYQAELARSGVDTAGFDRPVLVRMRSEPMTGAGRADMARELNVSQTEGFSPVEQAKSDARRLDADTLGLIEGDDAFAAANRPFLTGFVARVAPNDANALTDARGAISLAGKSRVQAALVQRAYGDEALTAALFETSDANIRSIGQALADAAPAWAKMRAEAPREMDLTANLTGAVALVREARAARMSVGELVAERLGQTDLFGGEALSPETGAMIQLMFRDEALTKPRAAERIAEALKDYARGAAETPAGPNLFGETPDGRAFLDTLLARYGAAEGEGQRGLAYAGGSEPAWTTREVDAPGLDLRPSEPVGERPGGAGDGQGSPGSPDGTGARDLAARRAANPIVFEAALEKQSSSAMAERYAAMSREEKLAWHADSELKYARASIARLETERPTAFTPAGSVPRLIAEYQARIAELEDLRSAGRLAEDHSLRVLSDARPVGDADGYAERLKAAGIDGVTVGPAEGHGPVLTGLEGRWNELVAALKALEDGDVRGALSHPAVGAIDMVWGKPAKNAQATDGWGLAKLLQKHPDVIADLPERLARMTVAEILPDRVRLESETDFAAVRLDWDREAKTWLVTAFAKEGKSRSGVGSAVSDALSGPAPSPDRSAETTIGESGAKSEGGRPTPEARVAAFIAADPELKALMADTEALAQANSVDMPGFERSTEPSTIAEAIRAAAFCLTTETVV